MVKKDSVNSRSSLRRRKSAGENGRMSQKKVARSDHRTLEYLLKKGLNEIYDAEKQLEKHLPMLAEACHSSDLEDAFYRHLRQTRRHADRLENVFARLGIRNGNSHERCEAMQGMIEESREIISEFGEGPVRDSALIIAAQKMEHYEIAVYGSLCELSDVLGYYNICDMLGKTLDEEEKTDLELTDIAMYVNDQAHEFSEEPG